MSSQTLHLTTASLLRTSILASLLAAVITVLFILPAEYNLDPTGLGENRESKLASYRQTRDQIIARLTDQFGAPDPA